MAKCQARHSMKKMQAVISGSIKNGDTLILSSAHLIRMQDWRKVTAMMHPAGLFYLRAPLLNELLPVKTWMRESRLFHARISGIIRLLPITISRSAKAG